MKIIQNIRLRWMVFKGRLKQLAFNFLLRLLKRIDAQQLKSALIGLKMSFSFQAVVPKDGKWHHMAATTQAWIKRNKRNKKTKKKYKNAYYLDGVKVSIKKRRRSKKTK